MVGELFAVWCDLCYNRRKQSESASVRPYRNSGVASLFASKESRFAYISTSGKSALNVILYMKDIQMCAYCPDAGKGGVFYNTLSVIKINEMLIFGGKRTVDQDPLPPSVRCVRFHKCR